jgi:hypothetical protein
MHTAIGILSIVAAGFLALLAHETGHLAGGLSAGFRFQMLTVGLMTIVREGGRIRFRWNLDWKLMGGIASALPAPGCDVRRGAMRLVLGGPLASVALAAVLLPAVPFLPRPWKAAPAMAGATSLLVGIVTMIPGKTGGFLTDGARFLQLRRGGREAERWLALSTAIAASQSELRPREWPLGAVDGEEWMDGSIDAIALASMLYWRDLDRGDAAGARRWMDAMLAGAEETPEPMRSAIYLEAAIPDGRVYLERVKPSPLLPAWGLARSEAFVLAAEGRGAEAAARRDEALRLLDREMPSGMTAFVREQLAGVR